MSINVTVKGNPVSIKRGKMVTTTADKAEFDKRRKLRLQQVRQQSSDIAFDIREKLKRAKNEKLSEIEREGQEKLKNWENRKLLDLQEQYEEALDEFGLAHQAAESEQAEEEAKQVQMNVERDVARSRGGAAFSRLQLEKNRKSYEKAKPHQRKKMSRDVENTRSAAVANIKGSRGDSAKKQGTSPFKRKKGGKQASDSDSENRVPRLVYGDGSSSEGIVESPKKTSLATESTVKEVSKKDQETSCRNLDEYVNQSPPRKERCIQTSDRPEVEPSAFPYDTRISERIRRRTILNKFCECDLKSSTPGTVLCDCCRCPFKPETLECCKFGVGAASGSTGVGGAGAGPPVDTGQFDRAQRYDSLSESRSPSKAPRPDSPVSNAESQKTAAKKARPQRVVGAQSGRSSRTPVKNPKVSAATRGSPKKAARMDTDEIPSKPKVTLRSAKTRTTRTEPGEDRVQQYDHRNRFTSLVSSTSRVEKVADDDVMTPSSGDSEADYREQMKQRDLEAHLRGQKAVQREQIHRDYKTLMKKLPALQREERIGEISMDKPQYHMGRDRLEEYERQKQNQLDNAYERLFVHGRPTSTASPPMVTLPRTDVQRSPTPSLNLADYEDEPQNRNAKLNEMLLNLQKQKIQLLRELGGDLGDSDEVAPTATEQKRKRGRTSPEYADSGADQTRAAEGRQSKKKRKVKVKTRVLQNTSTQTTPKPAGTPEKTSEEERGGAKSLSPLREPVTSDKSICCSKTHVPCACCGADRDLEILIKLMDGSVPEVAVSPASPRGTVKDEIDGEESSESETELSIPEQKEEEKRVKEKEERAREMEKKAREKEKKARAKEKEAKEKEKEKEKKKRKSQKKEAKIKSASWNSEMSKNSSTTSSSTSYMTLVDKSAMSGGIDRSCCSNDKSSASNDQQPQSRSRVSFTAKPGEMDPRLVAYIQKALFMPYGQLEQLSVSAASEVSTPSQSVVDIPSNKWPRQNMPPQQPQPSPYPSPCADDSTARLRSVMKYFNISPETFQKYIDAALAASSLNSTGRSQLSGPHYNTPRYNGPDGSRAVSSSSGSSTKYGGDSGNKFHDDSTKRRGDSSKHRGDSSKHRDDSSKHRSDSTKYQDGSTKHHDGSTKHHDGSTKHHDGSTKHHDGSNKYHDGSNKYHDGSAKFYDSAKYGDDSTKYGDNSSQSSSATVKSERTRMVEYTQIADHCTRKINDLTAKIEKVREEKKKIMTSTTTTPPCRVEPKTISPPKNTDDVDKNVLEIDMNLADQLKKMSPKEVQEKQERRLSVELEKKEVGTSSTDEQLLERMRRLLEPPAPSDVAATAGSGTTPPKTSTETSPPPIMLDIPKLAPLSVPSLSDEPAETRKRRKPPLTNAKLMSKVAGDGDDAGSNGIAPHELSTIAEVDSQPADASPKKSATPKKTPCPCPTSTSSGATDQSELDAMEQMLHNIGMYWAIPTLKKTREAMLAQSSSSSSNNSKSKSSSTDVSLKDFLIKHATPTDFMQDSHEESKKRLASTPVGDSGRGAVIFLDDSDISSVQNKSENKSGNNSNKLTPVAADTTDPLDKNLNPVEENAEEPSPRPKQKSQSLDAGMLNSTSAREREIAELLSKFRQIHEAKTDTSSKRSSVNSSLSYKSAKKSDNKSNKSTSLAADGTDPLDKNVTPATEKEEEPRLKRASAAKEDSSSNKNKSVDMGMLDSTSAREREVAELLSKFRQIHGADEDKTDTSTSRKTSNNSSKIPRPTSPSKSIKSVGNKDSSKDESTDKSKDSNKDDSVNKSKDSKKGGWFGSRKDKTR